MKKIVVLAMVLLFMPLPIYSQNREYVRNEESRQEKGGFHQEKRGTHQEKYETQKPRQEPRHFEKGYERSREFRRYYGNDRRFSYQYHFARNNRFFWGENWFLIAEQIPFGWRENDECYIDFVGYNWYLINIRLRSRILIIIN